jgi:hypothetical protein
MQRTKSQLAEEAHLIAEQERRIAESAVLRELEARRMEHQLLAEANSEVMFNTQAPLLQRAGAALASAGHTVAASYNDAVEKVNHVIYHSTDSLVVDASEDARYREQKRREHEMQSASEKSVMRDRASPVLKRAEAAVAAAGHDVAAVYQGVQEKADEAWMKWSGTSAPQKAESGSGRHSPQA